MMKRKLLFAIVALLCSVGSWAVTGSQITATMTDVFLYNVGSAQYLTAGDWWGTHATIGTAGMDLDLTKVSDGVYTIGTRQKGSQFLSGVWMDGSSMNFTFNEVDTENHYYTISYDDSGTKYLYSTGSTVEGGASVDGNNYYWQVVTRSNFISSLSGATNVSPKDATGAIYNAGFFVFDYATVKNADFPSIRSWQGTELTDTWGYRANESGNHGSNYCVEQAGKSFDNYQELTGMPNGKYVLKNQGFFRGTDDSKATYLYANDKEVKMERITAVYDAPEGYTGNDLQRSSYAIGIQNLYHNTCPAVLVTDGNLRIGVTSKTVSIDWSCFDNFTLEYYGNAIEVYNPTNGSGLADTWYSYTVASDGYYKISSEAAATIRYTQNINDDADTGGETVALAAGGYTVLNLTAGTFYFKSNATGDVNIEALSATNGTDVTSLFITNPSFETGDLSNWTNQNNAYSTRSGSDLSNKVGTHYAYINSNTSKSLSQTLSQLPGGYYVLSVNAKIAHSSTNYGTASINMGGNSTLIPCDLDAATYYVAYQASNDASATISFSKNGVYAYRYFDNFVLTYYNTLPDVSISDLTSEPMDGAIRAALDAANTAYTGDKTVVNYNALQTAIVNAKVSIAEFAAKTGADADWTGVIRNPSFETVTKTAGNVDVNYDGWTLNSGNGNSGNRDTEKMGNGRLVEGGGDHYFCWWTNSTNGSKVHQTVNNLPAGTYKLSAYVLTAAGTTITLKADNVTNTAVAPDGSAFKMETYFTLGSKSNVEIAIGTTSSQAWYNMDDVRLTFNPTMPSVTAVEGIMNSTVASTQTSAISTYEGSQTAANLNAALNAIAAAKGSIYYYTEALNILNNASALDAAGQASYAANETVAAIQSDYDGRTLTSVSNAQKTTCSAAYITAVKAQTTAGSDMTDAIVNPSFSTGKVDGWAITETSHGNQQYGSYTAESWNNNNVMYSQKIAGLHEGIYQLTAQVDNGRENNNVSLFVSDGTTEKTALATYRAISSYASTSADLIANEGLCQTTVIFPVANDNTTLTIGVKDESTDPLGWMIFDNFHLTYVGASLPASLDEVTGTLYAGLKTAANTAISAYNTAIATYNDNKTSENYTAALAAYDAAMEAIDAADNSKALYASNTNEDRTAYKTRMSELLAKTNVYTTEAYNKWYANVDANYAAGVYTDEEVVLLTEVGACQSATATTWHASNHIDDVLLSSWTIGGSQAYDFGTALHINTWSTEGNSDGSSFQTPFFEYWTEDVNILGANTMVSTMTGLDANKEYSLDILVRVRQTNDKTKAVNGITVQLSNGSAVDLTAGTQVGSTKFYLDHFKAFGSSDASGNLTITITVAENSNISWLSFKDLMLKPKAEVTVAANAGKYGTVIFPFTPDVSTGFDGITFYSIDGISGNTLTLSEPVTEPVANTPYLIKNDSGSDFSMPLSNWDIAEEDSYTAGMLTGVLTSSTIAASVEPTASDAGAYRYVLQTQNGAQAFYKVDADFTATAYKCYLTVPVAATGGGEIKAFYLDFGDADGIRSIDNAQLTKDSDEIFNLTGQRVSKAQKGIYIMNGKKVLVK